ncbi:hypothetical protein AGR6A_pb0012 [Agrobacterium sp. NCPPB 925]|nr:hypothetical protein AGR6A_pb0012 [Agrobacterium sp. NCPPB 925]
MKLNQVPSHSTCAQPRPKARAIPRISVSCARIALISGTVADVPKARSNSNCKRAVFAHSLLKNLASRSFRANSVVLFSLISFEPSDKAGTMIAVAATARPVLPKAAMIFSTSANIPNPYNPYSGSLPGVGVGFVTARGTFLPGEVGPGSPFGSLC